MTVALIFMIVSLVCLALAAFGVTTPPQIQLGWLGMFFWALSILMGRL